MRNCLLVPFTEKDDIVFWPYVGIIPRVNELVELLFWNEDYITQKIDLRYFLVKEVNTENYTMIVERIK